MEKNKRQIGYEDFQKSSHTVGNVDITLEHMKCNLPIHFPSGLNAAAESMGSCTISKMRLNPYAFLIVNWTNLFVFIDSKIGYFFESIVFTLE